MSEHPPQSGAGDGAAPRPPRRPRYRGTHPRRFEQRYKELDPQRFPEMQAHLRAQGRTPAGAHVPILCDEIIAALAPHPGACVADCTLGYGGHALAFLQRLQPGGLLLGFDVDGEQLEPARRRLTEAAEQAPLAEFKLFRRNFAGLAGVLAETLSGDGFDVIFADLGVSSMQIDDPRRGFSYKHDGPLDMRMDQRIARSAADWLRVLSASELAEILRAYGDEADAERIAAAIVAAPAHQPLSSTRALGRLVAQVKGVDSPAALAPTFQAIRIHVNDELGALRGLLRVAPHCLRPGGRFGVLTFHSGEDRLVKHAFREGAAAGQYDGEQRELIRPGPAERRDNPRSAAAKFRWTRRPA